MRIFWGAEIRVISVIMNSKNVLVVTDRQVGTFAGKLFSELEDAKPPLPPAAPLVKLLRGHPSNMGIKSKQQLMNFCEMSCR